jgi:hypothetical protein
MSNKIKRKRKPHSEETKRKIGLANSIAQKGKLKPWLLGRKLSEKTKEKIRQKLTGSKISKETRLKISKANKGKIHWWNIGNKQSEELKIKRGIYKRKGENHYRWIKDRTQLKRVSTQGDRRTSIYFNWRKEVWIRDNYKCKINNKDCKGRLEAHHIFNWIDYPELRYDINNGIALCHFHHPRKWEEEKRLSSYFKDLVSVSKEHNF